ncbi:MAG: S9 family peptidase [Saprospiraceae bacterium]|nr:S9 family peptidase [Saprospiraceae bacterium]
MKLFYAAFFIISIQVWGVAQKKEISLEDIYEKGMFRSKGIGDLSFGIDGKSFTRLEGNKINRYNIVTGTLMSVVFDAEKQAPELKDNIESYEFSVSERLLLLTTQSESIYRYSSVGNIFVYNIISSQLIRIYPEGKIMYPSISPKEDKIAFVYQNNLFVQDLSSGKIRKITKDGVKNSIINGASDWVYEEEFTLTRAFEWSPEGDQIAFIRFDESHVKEFSIDFHKDQVYPEIYKFKYPKVGEENSKLSVWNYHLKNKKPKILNTGIGKNDNVYIPRIKWTRDNNQLCVMWMNREQNHLKLILVDPKKNANKILFEERNKYYIELHDNLLFTKDGKYFHWTSEADGYNHLYRYTMEGKLNQQITKGKDELTEVYALSTDENTVYFQRSEKHGLERKIYSYNVISKALQCLTSGEGVFNAKVNFTADYFVISSSSIDQPSKHVVCNNKGEIVRVLEENNALKTRLSEFNYSPIELMTITNNSGIELNSLMIKPANFDPSKKYPVLMFLYGGPGSQQVMNRWGTISNFWWHQMIAQKGYIVFVTDNRGTGGKGENFKKLTYKQLGKYETEDQIDAAKYASSLPYVDGTRIGIFGWSYGGYMSTLCLLKGNDVFKSAIAVAPVTNWKWYDSIYTERYMGDENNNKESYKENSPVYFADRLKGNYLLIHGLADDNVHFQNSAEMAKELIKNKKQFDTYYYTNRNHGIYGENASMHLFTKMTNFVLEKI